jgi:hypothetical protein
MPSDLITRRSMATTLRSGANLGAVERQRNDGPRRGRWHVCEVSGYRVGRPPFSVAALSGTGYTVRCGFEAGAKESSVG